MTQIDLVNVMKELRDACEGTISDIGETLLNWVSSSALISFGFLIF